MKFLGWMLLLTFTTSHAQEVIESTPLSIEDNGARKIIEGNGSAPVVKEEPKEIIKIDEVEVKPESLEAVGAATAKDVKKEAKVSKKAKAKAKVPSKILVDEPAVIIAPVVVVPEKTNPADGQLKLDGTPAATSQPEVQVKVEEIKIEDKRIDDKKVVTVPVKTEAETMTVVFYENTLKKYLQFSFGFLDSDYEKIHPNLDNGSNLTSFAIVSDMTVRVQTGFAMELITDKSGQEIPDNIRSVQYRLFANYHAPIMGSSRVDWVGGLAFVIGDYGIRRRYINLQGEEASLKIKDGTIVGLIPAVGVRIYLVGKNSFDIMAEYHQYFGKPQSHIGGLAISPRLSFEF